MRPREGEVRGLSGHNKLSASPRLHGRTARPSSFLHPHISKSFLESEFVLSNTQRVTRRQWRGPSRP